MSGATKALLLVAVSSLLGCGLQPFACTEIGCSSGASLTLEVPIAEADLERATVTVCFNNVCNTGKGPKVNQGATLSGPLQVYCNLSDTMAAKPSIVVDFRLQEGDVKATGDTYSVTVSLPDKPNEVASSVAKTVTSYKVSTPNGDGCPPTCHRAIF